MMMTEPIVSKKFDVEDIRKIREYNSLRHMLHLFAPCVVPVSEWDHLPFHPSRLPPVDEGTFQTGTCRRHGAFCHGGACSLQAGHPLCDSWYPKKPVTGLVEEFKNLEMICCGRSDTVLYDLPGERIEEYSKLTNGVEAALDKADRYAADNDTRMSHEEVFGGLRRKINVQ